MVDAHREVMGMSDAYIPPSAEAVSIGLATPAATVSDFAARRSRRGAPNTPTSTSSPRSSPPIWPATSDPVG